MVGWPEQVAMRIAVEVTTCTAERAGIGYYTEHLVDAMVATSAPGDEVFLIGNQPLGRDVAAKWAGRLRTEGAGIRYVWMQTDAPRLLAEGGADFAVFPNYLAPLDAPCPYLNVIHDLALIRTPEFFNARKRILVRALLPIVTRAAAGVGTVSETSRRDLASMLSVPDRRIVMLPGAPHPSCRPSTPQEIARVRARYGLTRPYVLSVGTLEPRKNLPMLLRAFERLVARAGTPSANLDLVTVGGRGWRDRELRADLQRSLATGRVHAVGYVPEEDLIALYGGAEVLAYPSHFEGFGLPSLEAMACGTPVVASDVSALREVGGGAAVLVPVGDADALAARIAELVDDPRARAAASARGLARAAEFRWETTAARVWAFARAHARSPARVAAVPAPTPGALRATSAPGATALAAASSSPPGASDRATDRATDWGILATVAYADLFDAAMSVEEVARTCLRATVSCDEVRRRATRGTLASLVTLGGGGHLTLRGREHLIARRLEGIRLTRELLDRHRAVIAALATLPFIRMLALSGGTAHRNARGGDDIDLFVVAAAGRAYTAYTMLFLASRLTRTRGVVCPNYLVDEDHLTIAYHHDLFTAHQAISLVPIAGHATFARFTGANDGWVRAFYPGYEPQVPAASVGNRQVQSTVERLVAPLGGALERALRIGWRLHLAGRVARATGSDVVLAGGILKLHLSDHRVRVLDRYKARLDLLHERFAAWPQVGLGAGGGAVGAMATAGAASARGLARAHDGADEEEEEGQEVAGVFGAAPG
jgi:glycosyltransferase involved in cell wall biosynthesis